MGRGKTPQEVQNEYVLVMGDELGLVFTELAEQVAWLHDKWNSFRALYSDDERTIELLAATAPAFFDELARTLWADALLHLCRLTDAPEMNRV